VGLVDDEQRGLGLRHRREHLRLRQLLGREEDELDVTGRERLERRLAGPLALAAVGLHRTTGPGVLEQAGDLVALQGDERADDDRRAVDQQGRHLVHGALARARRHDDERVPPRHHVLHGLELAGAELVPAEGLARRAREAGGRACVQDELREQQGREAGGLAAGARTSRSGGRTCGTG
jgi:hypothetical protein